MGTKPAISLDQFEEILRSHEDSSYEFEDGELIPLSSPSYAHQLLESELLHWLKLHFRKHGLGDVLSNVDFRFSEESVRQPDISAVFVETRARLDVSRVPVPGAPDIAIEIVSPNDAASDINHKVRLYLRAGCREVWIVYMSDRQVQIWRHGGCRTFEEDSVLESTALPGFALPVNDLFSVLAEAQ
ncbi:MAG: Uma2 family endonuclease [Bryobacterales bacterium]|nr:Uma2 family endonuclease [Bryobacterales bacterium]